MGFLTSWAAVDWLILVLTLLGLVYLYCTWTFSHWKNVGVPFIPNPTPLFGTMRSVVIGGQAFSEFYLDIYKQLKGHVFGGFFKFREPAIMVCDPDLIKTVMTKDFPSFHDNEFDVSIDVDPMLGRNPFNLKGDSWKRVRSQLTPAFTPSKIKPLFPLINEVCRDMVEYLGKDVASTDGYDSKELSALYTTDVVATCAYGLKGNSFTDPNAVFRTMGRNLMMDSNWWRNFQITMIVMAPKLAKFFSFRLFDETITNFFRSVVKDAMQHREKNNVTRNDFLQLLMQLKAKGQVDDSNTSGVQHEKFTDEDVAAQALTFFSDGFETSSVAMSLVLFELAVNPDVFKLLRVEVDAALLKHGGELTYESLQDLPYLDMVLAETMRRNPPLSVLTRLCTKPYDLPTPSGGVYRVKVGTCVAIPILGLHTDPNIYPDPDRFDPERFSEENKASRHSYAYLPFGGGPRLCIGNRFATTQVKAGVAIIVANFDLQLSDRTPVPLIFDKKNIFPIVKDGIWIKFTKRAGTRK